MTPESTSVDSRAGEGDDHVDTDRLDLEDAFGRYRDEVSRSLMGRVDVDDLDDAVQEAFARASLHRDRIDPDRVVGWLITTARNVAVDWHRSRARSDGAPGCRDAPAEDRGCEGSAERSVDRLAVSGVLAALPPRQREVLWMCEAEGHSAPEAAALLGISVEATKSLRARARRTFCAAWSNGSRWALLWGAAPRLLQRATDRLRTNRIHSAPDVAQHVALATTALVLALGGGGVIDDPTGRANPAAAAAVFGGPTGSPDTGPSPDVVLGPKIWIAPLSSPSGTAHQDGHRPETDPWPGEGDVVIAEVEDPVAVPGDDQERGRTVIWIEDSESSVVLSTFLAVLAASCDGASLGCGVAGGS